MIFSEEIDINKIEQKINISFKNKQILVEAFTHRSFLNETKQTGIINNERLEFLGDAVLEIIVSEYLFNKYLDQKEGYLTAYRSAAVKMESLAESAQQMGLGDYIRMSKGEVLTGGRQRPYILANTFEALSWSYICRSRYSKVQRVFDA